ncbi:MAG: hypothetical protein WC284_16870 [Candidimonas sp.]
MSATIVRVIDVQKHPERDRLTVNTLSNGVICLSNLTDDGTPRYSIGDLVCHVSIDSVVPEWLLKRQDCWRVDSKGKEKGTLGGNRGDRVKPIKMGGITSEGMLVAGVMVNDDMGNAIRLTNDVTENVFVFGDDVTEFFQIS